MLDDVTIAIVQVGIILGVITIIGMVMMLLKGKKKEKKEEKAHIYLVCVVLETGEERSFLACEEGFDLIKNGWKDFSPPAREVSVLTPQGLWTDSRAAEAARDVEYDSEDHRIRM